MQSAIIKHLFAKNLLIIQEMTVNKQFKTKNK